MRDAAAFVEGGNLGLAVLVSILVLAAGLAWVGPARSFVGDALHELERKAARDEAWFERRDGVTAVAEAERLRWREDFEAVRAAGLGDADAPALMARVARLFAAGSVRGLEVLPIEAGESEPPPSVALREPEGSRGVELRELPLAVRLRASYSDLRHILERVESERSPLRIDRMELRREFPHIRLEARLTLWVRREVAA